MREPEIVSTQQIPVQKPGSQKTGERRARIRWHEHLSPLRAGPAASSSAVASSRRIARQLEENIAFRVLAAGNMPEHRTICRFREEHVEVFQSLFVQVIQIARDAGLVKMGTLAVDGSKIRANASKRKAMSYERMQQEEKRLRKEIQALTDRAAKRDAVEDVEFGPDFRGDELPEELRRREDRIAKIRQAKRRLEARKRDEAKASERKGR